MLGLPSALNLKKKKKKKKGKEKRSRWVSEHSMEEEISEFKPMEGLQSPVLQMAMKPAHLERALLTCKSN